MRSIACIAFLFVAVASYAGNLIAEISSAAYKEVPIPSDWIPAKHETTIVSAHDYPRSSVRSVEISEFVKVYGVPSRLLTPKTGDGYSYLVYELSGGYKILVYVPSNRGSRFSAAQLFRANGEPEGPLLK